MTQNADARRPVAAPSLSDIWVRFWFAPIPPHSYALLRILIGAVGCLNLIGLGDFHTLWSLDGLVPSEGRGVWLARLFTTTGVNDMGPIVLYVGSLAAFAAMTVGFKSGIAVAASLVASLLGVTWNSLPLSGADALLRGLLFCLIWADCGAVWSLDAWLAARRASSNGVPASTEHPIAPLRLIRFQVALLYLSTGLWKLYSPLWRDGSALHYVANNNVFHRFPAEMTAGLEPLLTFGTYLTLFWEIGFAFALWYRPTRLAVLTIGVLMHVGMLVGLEIGPFSLVMLSAYTAFLNPFWVASRSTVRDSTPAHISEPPQDAPLAPSRPPQLIG